MTTVPPPSMCTVQPTRAYGEGLWRCCETQGVVSPAGLEGELLKILQPRATWGERVRRGAGRRKTERRAQTNLGTSERKDEPSESGSGSVPLWAALSGPGRVVSTTLTARGELTRLIVCSVPHTTVKGASNQWQKGAPRGQKAFLGRAEDGEKVIPVAWDGSEGSNRGWTLCLPFTAHIFELPSAKNRGQRETSCLRS